MTAHKTMWHPSNKRAASTAAASLALLALLATVPAHTRALVLDDFQEGTTLKQPESAAQRVRGSRKLKESGPLKGVVGGSREVTVNLNDAGISAATTATAWVDPSANRLNYASTIGVKGSLELRYDANGKGFGQEFANATGLRLDIEADVSAVPYQVTLTASDRAGRTVSASRQVRLAGVQQVEIPFKDLVGINFKKLLSVTIAINAGPSGDLEIRSIEAVDPTTKQ